MPIKTPNAFVCATWTDKISLSAIYSVRPLLFLIQERILFVFQCVATFLFGILLLNCVIHSVDCRMSSCTQKRKLSLRVLSRK